MIKEEYRDIPDNEFVPLKEGIDKAFLGLYYINKLGQVRGPKKKIFDLTKSNKNYSYPKVTLSKDRFRRSYYVHRLVAEMFLVKPEDIDVEVDHIDRDRLNYNVNNLRWVTHVENVKNVDRNLTDYVIFRKYSADRELLYETTSRDISKSKITSIVRSILMNKVYDGGYWTKINKSVEDYYNRFTSEERSSEQWKSYNDRVEVSNLGVIKYKKGGGNATILSVGYKDELGYRIFGINNHRKPIHRLVAELFIKEAPLDKEEVIDHIDTVKDNNIYTNLRVCSNQAENMMNETTRSKLNKRILQYDLKGNYIRSFESRCELEKYVLENPTALKSQKISTKEININSIYGSCSGERITAFKYLWTYDVEDKDEVIKRKLEKFNNMVIIRDNKKKLNKDLVNYIERSIIPKYAEFDLAHREQHAKEVMSIIFN